MFKTSNAVSMVTAILPTNRTQDVMPELLRQSGSSALTWRARSTLLQDHWLKRWFPPISTPKTILQMLVPDSEVSHLVTSIIEHGRLHQQATGAVFSTPCDHVFFGTDFKSWPLREGAGVANASHSLTENLSITYAIVARAYSERVSKAAINAGAHGPIVYFSEGRGLRDRLGWLRITKEAEKEVLMVITDADDADHVFDAMAKAGELHLPGRGFMYRLNIDKGMFNLPSRVSHHHYDASMQQIIHAIDHLNGHTHWRDQSIFAVGGQGRGIGIDSLKSPITELDHQVSLSAIVPRDHCGSVMDMLLDAGAPGLNLNYARFYASEADSSHPSGSHLSQEHGLLRCITDEDTATHICATVEDQAERKNFKDFCMFVHSVPRVATYVPGKIDYREPEAASAS